MLSVKLIAREEAAEGTIILRMNKPDGFVFRAGQTLDLYLPQQKLTDSFGNSRTFSIASAPEDPELMVAMRIRQTAFKQTAKELGAGAELSVDGPFGSFHLPKDHSRPLVFLAGGIGATAFRSMVRHAVLTGLPHRITLIHSNRRPQDAPFLAEFEKLQKDNPNFKYIPTMSSDAFLPGWEGERGRINVDLLRKHVADIPGSAHYVAGPVQFNIAMRDLLNELGADDDLIRTDEFAGY